MDSTPYRQLRRCDLSLGVKTQSGSVLERPRAYVIVYHGFFFSFEARHTASRCFPFRTTFGVVTMMKDNFAAAGGGGGGVRRGDRMPNAVSPR